jgi:hypothetical protein
MVSDHVASLFLPVRPKACAGETAQVVSDLVLRAFELPQSLRGVIQRKWCRFTVEDIWVHREGLRREIQHKWCRTPRESFSYL